MKKTDYKYIGYLFNEPDTCVPIMEKTLEGVQKTIDIELNNREFTDDFQDLHCVVYKVSREIEIIESYKLNFKVEV